MTDLTEDGLLRALDDVLATCWNHETPILDAISEAATDWTAQVEAELNESEAFVPQQDSHQLADALDAMATAVARTVEVIPSRTFAAALTEALRDWSVNANTRSP